MGSYFTLRPAYRYYRQSEADYFAGFDISKFVANQFSLGVSYTDILIQRRIFGWGLKSVHFDANAYRRDNGFQAVLLAIGLRVVHD